MDGDDRCSMPREAIAGIKTNAVQGEMTRAKRSIRWSPDELTVLEDKKGDGFSSRGIRPKRPKAGAEKQRQPTGQAVRARKGRGLKLTALIVTGSNFRLPRRDGRAVIVLGRKQIETPG